ncbi:MAG: hypothetical protein U1E65_03800 [Myxococcota bacterium]
MASKKQAAREAKKELEELARPNTEAALGKVKGQLRTAAKVVGIALLVVWLLALGFWSGLDSFIPIYIAAVLSIAVGIGVFLVVRNLRKSEAYGALIHGGDELSPEERQARIAKLAADADKGDANAIMAKAQLEMQESPRAALATLERVNLDKAQKFIAAQVRTMRAMLHLNLGEVKDARALADAVVLDAAPDPKTRANLAAVVAEAWARSGNPIEARELLDKYDPEDKELEDLKMQLYRARVFTSAHGSDLTAMKKGLKALMNINPQLAAMFVGQKRIHPLLEKEAKKALEKSGVLPRPRVQFQRR